MQANVNNKSNDIKGKWDDFLQEMINSDEKLEELMNLSLAMFFQADVDEDGVLSFQEYVHFEDMLGRTIFRLMGITAQDLVFDFG